MKTGAVYVWDFVMSSFMSYGNADLIAMIAHLALRRLHTQVDALLHCWRRSNFDPCAGISLTQASGL